MEAKELERLRAELAAFLDVMTEGMGRMERCRAMQSYVTGLLLDGERKSIQPMAARLVQEPSEAEAMRQRLQECITISDWNEDKVWSRLALHVAAKMPELEAFVLDDTGFPKKGEHSVGVARQYSGTLGRVDNCQVATSLHLAGEAGSACIGMRLYLPEGWAKNEERRAKAGVPDAVEFRTKWQLGLELLDKALAWGLDKRVVLADAGYGDCMEFRQELRNRGLPYVLGILSTIVVWRPGEGPEPPPEGSTARPRAAGSRGKFLRPQATRPPRRAWHPGPQWLTCGCAMRRRLSARRPLAGRSPQSSPRPALPGESCRSIPYIFRRICCACQVQQSSSPPSIWQPPTTISRDLADCWRIGSA